MFEWLIHSMKAIYNSRITEEQNIQISADNRGFRYGDGLFETIVTGHRRINLVDRHLDRLIDHAQILAIDVPHSMKDQWQEEIVLLTELNQMNGDTRTKLMLWRADGGLYTPTNNSFDYLITQQPNQSSVLERKQRIGICQSIKNHVSVYANLKTLNALHYVLAGHEMKEKQLDEVILLDDKQNLSETHIGNLFWIKNDRLYTPSLSTGCIQGVMRGFILDYLKSTDLPCEVVVEKVDVLAQADSIFSTNASGITYFEAYDHQLKSPEPWISNLIKRLRQP